jgi:hypothetical protein
MRHALAPLVVALVFAGCQNQSQDCTTIAAVSVSVTVVDGDGVAVTDAIVTYAVEDSEQAVECDAGPDVFLCGYEVAGTLTIRAEAAGFTPAEAEVTVSEDECHVQGENLVLVLDPVDCPQVELPSVFVTIVDTDGLPIPDAWAEYAPTCADWFAPEVCVDGEGDSFVCGWGWTCPLYIDAYAVGHQSDFAMVDPEEDECGPTGTEYEFVLEAE